MTSSDANAVGLISRRGTLLGIASATAGRIAAAFSSNAFATQPPALPPPPSDVSPFSVRIPHGQRVDLKRRLAATRLPEREPVSDWSKGVRLERLRSLVPYWEKECDWRREERLLNSYPASA
jgi:epoxide hydrolase